MNSNRCSVNTQQSRNHNIITKKDFSDLSKDDLKKLTVNDTFSEKDLRNLIYATDSEDSLSENDCEDINKLKNKNKNKSISQPLHQCGNDRQTENSDSEKCTMEIEQNESSKLSTNQKLKQIAQENEMLTKKILAQKKPKKKINDGLTKVSSSAAVNRKKAQWGIDRTNQILYNKIQTAKPSGLSVRKGATLGRNTKLAV